MTRHAGARFVLAFCGLVIAVASARADEMFYYEKNGEVVFTNTPSRRDVKIGRAHV